MKNWKTTLLGVLAASAHVLSETPGIVGQIAKTVFVAALAFFGGSAADASKQK